STIAPNNSIKIPYKIHASLPGQNSNADFSITVAPDDFKTNPEFYTENEWVYTWTIEKFGNLLPIVNENAGVPNTIGGPLDLSQLSDGPYYLSFKIEDPYDDENYVQSSFAFQV